MVDELSLMGESHIYKSGSYQDLVDESLVPKDVSLQQCEVDDLKGGDAELNAQILINVLSGKDKGQLKLESLLIAEQLSIDFISYRKWLNN